EAILNQITDNCSANLVVTLGDAVFTCEDVGKIEGLNDLTYSVTDGSNTVTGSLSVTVEDKIGPKVVTKNITIPLVGQTATITPDMIDNGSTDACGIKTMTLDITAFNRTHVGENTVT